MNVLVSIYFKIKELNILGREGWGGRQKTVLEQQLKNLKKRIKHFNKMLLF